MARAGKQPRKTSTRDYTRIENGLLFFEDAQQCQLDDPLFADYISKEKAIRVVTLATAWTERQWVSWEFKAETAINIEMTLRVEIRSGARYWYAYRRTGGKLYKRFVGDDNAITTKRIVEIAQKMP